MSDSWCEIHIHIPAAAVDLVCAALGELGSSGVTVEERRLDTFIPPDPDEPLVGPVRLRAYFDVEAAGVEALRLAIYERLRWLAPLFPGLEAHLPEVSTVHNEDWAEGWKQHFPVVHIGRRLVIRPSWEEYSPVGDEVVVVLDPGMAFGTGTHGTTRLCLEALASRFETPSRHGGSSTSAPDRESWRSPPRRWGPNGCWRAISRPNPVASPAENVRNNGLQTQVEVTGTLLEELEGDFDLVLANILAEENIRLAEPLVSRVRPGGTLVLSGILQEKETLVATAFRDYPLSGPQFFRSEDWSCLVYSRNR